MKGTFDFFNYNYSAMISIFAALMGMAYPLILQAVQRIDEVYQSTQLTKYVQEQLEFKRFNIALIIAVFVSFLSSFVIASINDTQLILYMEFFHTLTVLYLSYASIKLFRFILRANNPEDLFEYIKSNGPDDNDGKMLQSTTFTAAKPSKGIVEIFQIAKYASAHEDYNLYRNCMNVIIPTIQLGTKSGKHSEDVWTVMYELCNQLKREKDSLFTSDCFIRDIYFYNNDCITYSEEDFKYIWYSLSVISKREKDSWVYEYWSSADQFYRFRLENQESSFNDFISRYKEFHVMLGAMLVYHKKWSLLNEILTFTNVFPPLFPLIPGTYSDILKSIEIIHSYCDSPLLLQQRYSIPGMGRDLNTDQKILLEAYRYHALLIIRLNQLTDYWCHINKYAIPILGEDENTKDIEEHIRIVRTLKRQIIYWYNEDRINWLNIIFEIVPPIDDIIKLLDGHLAYYDTRKNELENTTEVDHGKIEYLKTKLIKEELSHPVHLPKKNDIGIETDHPSKISKSQYIASKLNGEIIRKGNPYNASNLPELLINQLNYRLYQEYNNIFLLNRATFAARIKFEEIKEAFNKLGVSKDYVILSNVHLGTLESMYGNQGKAFVKENNVSFYNGARIFDMTSNTDTILIIKKKDVPYIAFEEIIKTKGLTKLSDDHSSCLYTNIDEITEALDEIELDVYRGVKLYIPNYPIKYVRLNISHYSNDTSELEKLEHFII